MHDCVRTSDAVRLSPTTVGKRILPFQSPLFTRSNRSNRRAKHGRQTAFEERGEVKLQSLSPRMHLSPPQGRGGRGKGRAGSSAGLGLRAARCAAAGGREWRRGGARRRRALKEGPSCPHCRAPLPSSSRLRRRSRSPARALLSSRTLASTGQRHPPPPSRSARPRPPASSAPQIRRCTSPAAASTCHRRRGQEPDAHL